ncbi:MAG: succinylglutamate desuccinylase/aspartoacylase family protein [Thermoplasmata archaeon]|nr:succinylglutamate desuccinylase/aspartoacylase family protein [Thermoplasmata archaeon]
MEKINLDIGEGEVRKGIIKCTELEDSTPVIIPYFVMRGIQDKPIMLLNAAIHGDELNGIEVINRVFDAIDIRKLRGTIVGVPIVNTIAFRARNRFDPVDGKDLNRFFPGDDKGSITQRIAHCFFHKFVKRVNFGIDLHTGMKGHLLMSHPRVRKFNDIDQPIEYSMALGTDIIFHHDGAEGMLNIQAEKIGKHIVCFENGVAGVVDEYYINEAMKGVFNFMKYFGMIDGHAIMPEKQVVLTGYEEIGAKRGGIFIPYVSPGDVVKKGEYVGYIRIPFSGEKKYVRAIDNGVVVGIRTQPLVRPGTTVAWLLPFDGAEIIEPLEGDNIKYRKSEILDKMKKKGITI